MDAVFADAGFATGAVAFIAADFRAVALGADLAACAIAAPGKNIIKASNIVIFFIGDTRISMRPSLWQQGITSLKCERQESVTKPVPEVL